MKGLFVQTYGCQMNSSDSERMKAVLAPVGYESVTKPDQADLILINTCSVRDNAESKTDSFSSQLRQLRKKNPTLKIGVTGCVAQQEKDNLLERLPWVDMVLGPDNIDELPWLIDDLLQNPNKRLARAEFDSSDARTWNTQSKILNPGPTTFVNIMKGCDHYCSYCIVPYTRGREKSRPISDVIEDCKRLTDLGVREITFLGQNINTFGKRTGESLHELLRRAHEIENLKRIRFTTSHPGDIHDELIRCFEDLPKLCSHFHLPVQSGSNRILRSMRRFYTRELYLERVNAIRQARSDVSFSTDVIVGFPGETEEDLLQTLDLIDQVKYGNGYSFTYSQRPGTSASTLKDDTPEDVKLERLSRVQKRIQHWSLLEHQNTVGTVQEILLEGPSKKDAKKLTGRSSQNVPVHIEALPQYRAGDLVNVRIESATLTHLKARTTHPQEALLSKSGSDSDWAAAPV